jgi:hypothetical protein
VNISKLLKRLFMSFVLFADGDGEGAGGDPMDELSALIPDEADEGEDETDAGQQGGTQTQPVQAQAEDPNEPTFTLKVDGEERVVKQSDLLASAQKYLAGDKRLEEAAKLRKEVEPERAAVLAERQQLGQALQHYTAQLTTVLQATQPNREQLAAENPGEYVRQRHAWEQKLGELQRAQEAQAILTQRQQQDQMKAAQARGAEEQEKLLTVLPEWKDPAKAKTEAAAVDGYLKAQGFTDDERNGIADHRVVVITRKAMLYDELMKSQGTAAQRVKNVPPRAERPGVSTQTTQASADRSKALERFSKAPSIDTLADLL